MRATIIRELPPIRSDHPAWSIVNWFGCNQVVTGLLSGSAGVEGVSATDGVLRRTSSNDLESLTARTKSFEIFNALQIRA